MTYIKQNGEVGLETAHLSFVSAEWNVMNARSTEELWSAEHGLSDSESDQGRDGRAKFHA